MRHNFIASNISTIAIVFIISIMVITALVQNHEENDYLSTSSTTYSTICLEGVQYWQGLQILEHRNNTLAGFLAVKMSKNGSIITCEENEK